MEKTATQQSTEEMFIYKMPIPEALLNARQAVKDDKTLYRNVFLACAELVKISQANDTKDEDRDVFTKSDEVEATEKIGVDLYAKGDLYEITLSSVSDNAKETHLHLGLGCMMLAHEIASPMFKDVIDARLLEFAWSGIGGWQA